jgi:hypothetical protein
MKKLRILILLLLIFLMQLFADVSVRASGALVNTDVSGKQGPPPWAPAHGYRAQTRYVYFPAVAVYFDLRLGMYAYVENGSWVTVRTLPARYSHHDFKKLKQEELPSGMDPKSHHRNRGKGHGKQKGKGQGRGR